VLQCLSVESSPRRGFIKIGYVDIIRICRIGAGSLRKALPESVDRRSTKRLGVVYLKAIILAGGFGTRLRPLSCTRPKQLFPVANRPLLDWTLEGLAKHGVGEVVLAVNYMAEALERHYGKEKYGISIRYSREERPLGTAGPLKKAENLLRDGPFLVLNGDVIAEVEYSAMLENHRRTGALATILLHEVEDASRYGVVEIDEDDRILRFVEKPKPEEAPSNMINAGAYVVDPTVLERIPVQSRRVMVEKEVFPRLAEEGVLFGFKSTGLWIDIGKPADYLKANHALLERIGEKVGDDAKIDGSVEIEPPVVIGSRVRIGRNSHVGPYTAVGDDVEIGEGTRIESSTIFAGALIDNFSSLRSAIIGEGAMIGKWVKIEEQTIVGDHAEIHDNLTVTKFTMVCPSKEVETSILEPRVVM
jgi:mannose-1-phosphate guanylyltransferase